MKRANYKLFLILQKAIQVILICGILLVSAFFLPQFAAFHCFAVQTGSMEPILPVGSLIYVHRNTDNVYKEGDIITYLLNQEGTIVTHRIVERIPAEHSYKTKGDANDSMDGGSVLENNIIGEVKLCIPYLGRVFVFLSGETGKIIWVGVLIGLFILSELLQRTKSIRMFRQLA